jgi:hypothetical protein
MGEIKCGLNQPMHRITHPPSIRSNGRATATSGTNRLEGLFSRARAGQIYTSGLLIAHQGGGHGIWTQRMAL